MATIMPSDVADITTFYLENYMADSWADAYRPLQHYTTASELFTTRREREDASEKATFNLKIAAADNTTADSFFKADSLNRVDLGVKGEVKWHFQKTHFMVDRREPAMLSGSKTRILNYLKMQENDMYDGFFEKNENYAWSLPATPNDGSAGDPLPFGIPYWIVTSATAAFGFNGNLPGNYTTTHAGITVANVPNWRNGTFGWTSMSNADFCKKLSEAMNKCHFRPPHPIPEEKVPSPANQKLYSDYTTFENYEDLLYASNDDIGEDMGRYRGGKPTNETGRHMFRGIPWEWVPAFTEDTTGLANTSSELIYGVNWDTFTLKTYADLFMDRDKPLQIDSQHNTIVQWMDTGYQICCNNRRANFVGLQA